MYSLACPKDVSASFVANVNSFSSSSILLAILIPLPPPPLSALIKTGKPICLAIFLASSRETGLIEPGTIGTPTLFAISLVLDLDSKSSITLHFGPIQIAPESSTAFANFAFSDRKP